jgi:hypothetical protein
MCNIFAIYNFRKEIDFELEIKLLKKILISITFATPKIKIIFNQTAPNMALHLHIWSPNTPKLAETRSTEEESEL